MAFCEPQIADDLVDLVWLHPDQLLEMEGSSCHASKSYGTFVETQEKRADRLHHLRQDTLPISRARPFLLHEVERYVTNLSRYIFATPHWSDTACCWYPEIVEAQLPVGELAEHRVVSWLSL